MSNQVDAAIRSREAFNLARAALNQMEKAQIWPTPLNFELWLHLICEPDGAIAQEIARLMSLGAVLTDAMAEELKNFSSSFISPDSSKRRVNS